MENNIISPLQIVLANSKRPLKNKPVSEQQNSNIDWNTIDDLNKLISALDFAVDKLTSLNQNLAVKKIEEILKRKA